MAYIRQYAGKWRAEVEKNGNRASFLADTKREAQAWALKKEIELGALKSSGGKTFEAAVEMYRQTVTPKKQGSKWEGNALNRLLLHIPGQTALVKIDSATIAKWRDKRLETVSGSTVVREVNLLRNIFTVARDEWKWIDHDPFKGVKMPEENPPRTAVWPWQLMKRVLRARREGKTAETIQAFRVALHTGLRLSEVLNQRYDARRRVLILGKTKTTRAGEIVEVPVMRRATKLFPQKFTVDPNEASVLFSNLCKELLIEGLTFHDTRATALTLMARRMDVMTLARISRHKDLRILMNTYYRETAEQIAKRL